MPDSVVQPQAQLISVKLNDSNFLLWKQQVWAAAAGYGLDTYLTGQEATPTETIVDPDSGSLIPNPMFMKWKRQDQLVTVVGLSTASQIWRSIEDTFANQNKPKVMQIRLQLQVLKKGNLNMREYLNKIKSCCDLLIAAGEKISESDQLLYILGGLGSEYNPVVVTLTSRSPTQQIFLSEVHSILLSLENRLETIDNPFAGVGDNNFSVNLST